MTDLDAVKYVDQMCEKTGDIEVKNIKADGQVSITESIEEVMMQAQEFSQLADKYGFKVLSQGSKFNLCAKNIDNRWTPWITYDSQRDSVSFHGNTDQLNIWLCDTRKDLTPEKCLSFVDELNKIFYLTGKGRFLVKDLIDPEDWQELANVPDAYGDKRFVSGRHSTIDDIIASAGNKISTDPTNQRSAKEYVR